MRRSARKWRNRVFVSLLVIVLSVAIAGCSSNNKSQKTTKELTKVNLRLSWLVKGEYAPLFVAQQKGYFKDEGLDVNIEEGSEKAIPTQLLVTGQDQFAYITANDYVLARDKGMKLTMVADFLQKSPQIVMARPGTKLDSPADMAGKSMVDTAGGTLGQILGPFLKANGVDPKSVKLVITDQGAKYNAFLKGDVDFLSAYATNDLPLLTAQTGNKFPTISIADFGFNILAHGLVASQDYVAKNPNVVKGMIRAIQKGVDFTVKNPEEAADLIQGLFPEKLKKDVTRLQVAQTIKLFHTDATKDKPYGWQAAEDWDRTIKILKDNGFLKNPENASNYYTNDYIK